MSTSRFLDEESGERLLWIIEASLRVCTESAFYLWSQGILQSLVPHDILICGTASPGGRQFRMHKFTNARDFNEERFREICDPRDGLLTGLINEWDKCGMPCLLFPGEGTAETGQMLQVSGFRNLAAHGVRGPSGAVEGFFCFLRTKLDDSERSGYLLEIMTPILHATFTRVLAETARSKAGSGRLRGNGVLHGDRVVTAREVEILHWIKEGKTTADIAKGLDLSPFTVKNHVQKILRKLSARSRSHAIAEAISRGILRDGA